MATGLAVPVRVVQGRAVVLDGPDQLDKLISLAVAEGLSANPYNSDVGVQAPIFDLQDATQRAILDRAVRRHFERLQAGGRAELLQLQINVGDDDSETLVEIVFRDLETDEQRPVTVKIGSK